MLTEAWKKITFNDFHDLAAGSGIGIIYKDAQRDYDRVRWATSEISSNALTALAAHVNTAAGSGVPVLIFNPLAWQRSGLIKIDVQMPAANARALPSSIRRATCCRPKFLPAIQATNSYHLLVDVKNVPSMGYTVLHVVPEAKPAASDLKVNGLTIENANLRVTVDPKTGCITSLFEKRSNFESLASGGCGNQLQTFKDTPKDYDAWNIDPGTLDHMTPIDIVDSVRIDREGTAARRDSRDTQLAKLEVRAGHNALRGRGSS